MKATSDKLTSILKKCYNYGKNKMSSFSGAAFWSSFLPGRFPGEQTSLHFLSLTHILLVLRRCCSIPMRRQRRFLHRCV